MQPSAQEIKLGMSAPLSGPSKNIGIQLKQGADLYFEHYNRSPAGLKNPIKLITYDDGYEPYLTMINTKRFIEDDNVFSLFSYVGTPNSFAIMSLIKKQQMLYFSPYTGADFLRKPLQPHIFNIRTGYDNEAAVQTKYFLEDLKLTNVALFIQADEFGLAASRGYAKSLKKHGIEEFNTVRYKRNTQGVNDAAAQLINLNPEIIFCIGTYEPISLMVNNIRANNINSKVVIVSFAGERSLHQSLTNFDEVYITSVLPNPSTSELAIIKEYRAAMAGKELSTESLEGYINAATFTEIIKHIPNDITRESFIESAEKLTFTQSGLNISFSPDNHQALDNVFLNKITQDKTILVPLSQ